jgi:hypothetical protein
MFRRHQLNEWDWLSCGCNFEDSPTAEQDKKYFALSPNTPITKFWTVFIFVASARCDMFCHCVEMNRFGTCPRLTMKVRPILSNTFIAF